MSNVQYVIYDATGVIVQSGHCPEEVLSLMSTARGTALVGAGDCINNYVLNGVIYAYTTAELQTKNNLTEGFVWQMPERVAVDTRALADAQTQAWTRVKTARDTASTAPFTCNGLVYQANTVQISGAVQLALLAQMANTPFSIDWTLLDNTVTTLNAAGMIAVGTALGTTVSSIYDTARTLRTQIYATTTAAQADAINWPT